ncbi:hypothetical protein TNCV_3352501 [Trichonephila clavipes]|nr:hypothetical protein TNCV_3352501 [Trichonephila clavipes]
MRAIGDEPHNYESWSRDEDGIRSFSLISKLHLQNKVRSSKVTVVGTDSRSVCHEFEAGTAKHLQCGEDLWMLNLSRA